MIRLLKNFFFRKDRIGPDILVSQIIISIFGIRNNFLFKFLFKELGDDSEIRKGSYLIGCSKIIIGKRVIIRPNSMFFGASESLTTSIIIENDVMIGSGVHIYIHNHRFDKNEPIVKQGYYPDKKVTLKKGCWIGANSIILPGVTIGENSVVGAGSIVNKSIPPRTLFAGNPARFIRKLND